MNNKDNGKLKKSLIICGVFMVIVLALYIGSVFINSNVAKKMNGRALFTTSDNRVIMYDFDNNEDLTVADKAKEAVFYENGIAYIGTDREDYDTIYMYDSDEKKSEAFASFEETVTLKNLCIMDKKLLALYESGGEYAIISLDKEGNRQEIFKTNDKITDICFDKEENDIYYALYDGDNSYVHSIMTNGAGDTKIFKVEDITNLTMNCYDKDIYLTECEDGVQKAAVYKSKTKKAEILKFSTDDMNVENFIPITGSKFIALCKDNNEQALYVCNGSNKVVLEQLKDYPVTAVTDYIQ